MIPLAREYSSKSELLIDGCNGLQWKNMVGDLVALQWALLMHGFDPAEEVIGDGLPDVDPSPLPRRLDFWP